MTETKRKSKTTTDLTGSAIGHYQIVGLLGKGGMATVYRARQESMARDVAIKVVPTDSAESTEMTQRFEREVRLIAQLQYPQILPVYDFGRTQDFTYLVMRLVETGTLADRLENGALATGRGIGLDRTADILDQLASALDYAHEHGIVHRDLKPANVFLDEKWNVYLADFGLAKLLERVDTQLTATGYVLGTPAYMSPEQITDQPVDRRVDVYALGLILFEMLTGQRVFSGSSPASIIFKHVSEPPPLPSSLVSDLTPQIDAVVLKALAKSPDDRYQTAGELAAAFRAATSVALGSVTPPDERPQPITPAARPSATTGANQKRAFARWPIGSSAGGRPLALGRTSALAAGSLLAILVIALISVFAVRNLLSDTRPDDINQGTPLQPVADVGHVLTPTLTVTRTIAPITSALTPTPVAELPTSAPTGVTLADERPPHTPTVSPTVEPVIETSTPTAGGQTSAPTPLPATATADPARTHAAQRVGRLRFLSGQSRLDTVNLQLTGIETAPTGKHYEGWLVGDAGNLLSIGILAPDGNGNVDLGYTDPEGRNLAAIYSGFRASLEPDFGDVPEISQEIVLEGAIHSAVVPLVREAVLRSVEMPLLSLIEGLETEAAVGQDHLGFVRNEFANDNLAGGLNHAEHAINTLVGSADARFGDKNGDGQTQNPGDGYGVLGYLDTLLAKAVAAGQADPASEELALHVAYLQAVIGNSQQRTDGIVQLLERLFVQDSAASALALVDQALALYDELLNGLDLNGNGKAEPIQGEGGILLVVQHTGYLANIEVYRVQRP